MLMDILMEALMTMDNEALDSVLESCDAEELEIISDAMEARFEDGPTVASQNQTGAKVTRNAIRNAYERKVSAAPVTDDERDRMKRIAMDKRSADSVAKTWGKFNARNIATAPNEDLKNRLKERAEYSRKLGPSRDWLRNANTVDGRFPRYRTLNAIGEDRDAIK